MIPRPVACDYDRCDYDAVGWVHDPSCGTQTEDAPWGGDDMAAATAREDGYSRAYGVAPYQQRSAA